MSNEITTTVASKERGKVTYKVAGQDVTLSYDIVRNFLTKGNGNVTDSDLTQFISICKYNQLNPFLGEAYLVKYGNSPASMIVSKEALFKRAEGNEAYEGIQAGIIVQRNGEYLELEGCFYGQHDVLVGGWAKVYRKDRIHPVVAKVRLEEYDKRQSTWDNIKSTMISKVAKVQALREAFPTQLGAMYTEEEVRVIDVEHEDVTEEIKTQANKETLTLPENEEKPKPTTKQVTSKTQASESEEIPSMFN